MTYASTRKIVARLGLLSLFVVALPCEAVTFQLTSSNVDITQPAPLFTSLTVSGSVTLADTVLPGQSFGASSVSDAYLNFAGITGTLADVQNDIAPGPVQIFGTRSVDGNSFSVFDFRFGFPPSTPGCSFVCAGQIVINSPLGPNDPSNFIALDDVGGNSLSVINSFTPHFDLAAAVPEPASWAMMILGMGIVGAALRRRRTAAQVMNYHAFSTL